MKLILSFVFIQILFLSVGLANSKKELVQQLSALQSKQNEALKQIDKELSALVQKTKEMDLKDAINGKITFTSFTHDTTKLNEQAAELSLRIQFVDQLMFQIENRFSGDNTKEFIARSLAEMALTELGVGSFDRKGRPNYWNFLIFLSIAIRILPEQIESPAVFIENYLNYSSITKPKDPSEFSAGQNYVGSSKVEVPKPITPPETQQKIDDEMDTPADYSN